MAYWAYSLKVEEQEDVEPGVLTWRRTRLGIGAISFSVVNRDVFEDGFVSRAFLKTICFKKCCLRTTGLKDIGLCNLFRQR